MDKSRSWHTFEEPSEDAEAVAKAVIGAAIEVHRHLGPGQKESAYVAALCVEFSLRNIPHDREVPVAVDYKGTRVATGLVDLIAAGLVILELKAVEQVVPAHVSQTIAYLRMTGLRLGLVINFNVAALKDGIRRIVLS